jgi:hypothetical protein
MTRKGSISDDFLDIIGCFILSARIFVVRPVRHRRLPLLHSRAQGKLYRFVKANVKCLLPGFHWGNMPSLRLPDYGIDFAIPFH